MALPIKEIKKYNFYPSLRARACRVWIAKFNGQPSSFNCVFVDNQGGAIQAVAKTRDLPTFAAIVIEGNHYEIKGFYTYENRAVNTVAAHDAVIDLKSNTKITGIEAITPFVPRYYFNFIDYAHIMTKSKSSRILTDVLGRLKALQPLEQVMVRGQTLENKIEFMLENIRGEELRITLWGDSARDFDGLALHNLPSPVIIAFAGFRVTEFKGKPNLNSTTASLWYFNPDIPECLAYKHFFAQLPVEIQQLPSSSNVVLSIKEQIKENRRTIHEILCMNPYEHKHLRFTCQASIVDFDFPNGWWYPSCPKCNKKLSGGKNNYTCMDHDAITSLPIPWFRLECIVIDGEDVTNFLLFGKTAENFFGSSAHHYVYDKKFIDPSVIPPAMAAKLNKSMIFQLRFGAFRSITNKCEVIITNIFDNSTNESIHPLETTTPEAKSSPTSKTSTPLSYMKQVLKAPSTPQNTVTQLRIAPDSLETPPQNISPNKETSINSEARRALDFEDATQQLSHEDEHDKAIEVQGNLGNIATSETFDHSLPPLKKQRATSSSSLKLDLRIWDHSAVQPMFGSVELSKSPYTVKKQ
ncbi:hypothetical protein NC653_032229 [Populus alba x Populus x berolinensis]|uniref:Replication protein A OB domain-containing protein n=1 Tax=Populus alba x Populus x berolinensis TaxID=444605 RepID=A0AAD6LQW2_9ROSI|nr:hypothetical protein NC653_032229 [Populus alba x Populus x berolinensis]